MKLPHLPPILFAHKVLKKHEKYAEVFCVFPCIPSLPMLLEAAAQSSVALAKDSKVEGMLVGASDVKMMQKPISTECIIAICEEVRMGNMAIFSFSIEPYAKGKVTIYV